MKLNEILNEVQNSSILETLQRDCAPIIAEYNKVGTPLMRGMSSTTIAPMTVISPRLGGRAPKDTDIDIHNYINKYFMKHHGAPYRDALFTTSDWDAAEHYGEAYVLFPIGQLKYLWSPQVSDLYDTIAKLATSQSTDSKIKYDKDFYQKLDAILSTYIDNNIHEALEDGSEVMVANNCYVVTTDIWYDELDNAINLNHD